MLGGESDPIIGADAEFMSILKDLSDLAGREENIESVPEWIMSIQKSNVKERLNFMKMLATLDDLRSKICRIKLPRAISHLLKLTEVQLRETSGTSQSSSRPVNTGSSMDNVIEFLAYSSTTCSGS